MDKLTDRVDKKAVTSDKLIQLIKKAMNDLEISTSEYQQIMEQAQADGVVDAGEQKILQEFQTMISNGTITRVPG